MEVNEINELGALIQKAYNRIHKHILKTHLLHSLELSKQTGCKVHLKMESEQKTGSFKVRGAFNKLMMCMEEGKAGQGFVTASTGNHGMGSALAFSVLKQTGTVFVPNKVSPAKEQALKLYNVKLEKFGDDCVETEVRARKYAEDKNLVYISPYADRDIICGQGTIGTELLLDLPEIDAVFVTVGGGGLISGIAAYLKTQKPSVEVIGCLPRNSPVMMESVKQGRIVEMESLDTLSDASAGGIEDGSPTFPLCQILVDKWVDVSESEISSAMYYMLEVHHKIVEGSAGVALAAFLQCHENYKAKTVAIIICGANLSMDNLHFVLNNHKS